MSTSKSDPIPAAPRSPPPVLALELTCPICLRMFSEPVSLPCGHIYCGDCIQTMGEGLDQHRCPECHLEFRGNRDIVKSSKISRIVESYKVAGGQMNNSSQSEITQLHESPVEDEPRQDKSGLGPLSSDQLPAARTVAALDQPKRDLASKVTELSLKLEMAESLLKCETEREVEAAAANSLQRDKISSLVIQIKDLSLNYCSQVTKVIEEELAPSEVDMSARVARAAELTKQLRTAVLRAESLLTEDDEAAFSEELQSLQPHIAELIKSPVEPEKDRPECKASPARICSKLEQVNLELREGLTAIQRSLRNAVNPSEVTFDPETAHPNLVLSDDRKTVMFSAAKQLYPSSAARFTSFFQVLSSQSFQEGSHCWTVELEGAPWIIGLAYSEGFERSGVASALESNRNSWCLMWFNNLLTAFEKGQSVPLKKTSLSRQLEIRLCFKTHSISFFNISPYSENTHIYTFKAVLTQPVHVAYRMLSGHPKGRVSISS
ncbi:zinc-binding protein A33 [Synchiropus splendidus]|uniref:zinc-binding protein A33 n=1 Tax=Synchiropus splendidus TaxID=270530 RepID=UPI00237E8368|nr:zinc-binding protein A33 [Synchiropus splendidus]